MKVTFDLGPQSYSVELTPSGKSYRVNAGEQVLDAQILQAEDGRLDLFIEGRRVTAYVSSHGKLQTDSEINVFIKEELQ